MLDQRTAAALPDRLRLRALGALDAGPAGVLPLLWASALATGVAGLAVLRGRGPLVMPPFAASARPCLVALVVAGLAGAVATAVTRRRRRVDPAARRDLATTTILAVAALLPALLVPLHYAVAATHRPKVVWVSYGFLDRRWLTSLFLISTVGAALLLVVASRVVTTAPLQPGSWRRWAAEVTRGANGGAAAAAVDAQRTGAGPWPVAAKVLCAVLVAAYFFGPPWHLAAGRIGYHETQAMQGVQGIHTGSVPYLDAAAIQYGPGAEVTDYLFPKATHELSVDGLRRTSLLFTWIAVTLFAVALYLRARPVVATVTTIAAVAFFPTLRMFHLTAGGTFEGFWGWANPLRYVGVFLLAMLFPAVIRRPRGHARSAAGIGLGALWAVLCLAAQENLIGGALLLGALSVLLVASQTAAGRAVLTALAAVATGFALAVAPVLAFYLAHGRLGRFLELYWLVPRAVAAGYSNMRWTTVRPLDQRYDTLFHVLPLLLIGLMLAALLAGRPLRVATAWSDRRVVLVSALVAALICHVGALTRSDAWHLINTGIAVPAAICLAAFELPALLGARSVAWRWAGGAAIVLTALALLPLPLSSAPRTLADVLWWPAKARVVPPPPRPLPKGLPAHSVAVARIGPSTLRQPICCQKHHAGIPMAQFVRFLDRLHALVGTRTVYVESTPTVSSSGVYFLADLRPAAAPQQFGTMVLDTGMREQWYAAMRAQLPDIGAIITLNPRRRLPAMWSAVHPRHRTVKVPYGRKGYTLVLLA